MSQERAETIQNRREFLLKTVGGAALFGIFSKISLAQAADIHPDIWAGLKHVASSLPKEMKDAVTIITAHPGAMPALDAGLTLTLHNSKPNGTKEQQRIILANEKLLVEKTLECFFLITKLRRDHAVSKAAALLIRHISRQFQGNSIFT